MALDADTQKYLEEVKKGKPRRFAMIMKGEKILSLIIYKKGTVEKYKKQAKEEGKGQFYHGVIDGKGQAISFKLSTSDGFDAPPGKDVKLKAFLNEASGMKFKPVYEIVSELPGVDEAEDGEQLPPVAPPPPTSSTEVPPVAPPPPTSGTDVPPEAPPSPAPVDGATFMARLKAMLPQLKQAQAAGTPFEAQLKTLAAQAQAQGKAKNYAEAMQTLDELEGVIQQALSAPPAPPPAPPPQSVDGTTFMNRLKGLLPELKQAQAAAGPLSQQLAGLTAEAQKLGKEKKYAEGMETLNQLEGVIKSALASSGDGAVKGDPLVIWRDAKESVDEQINKFASVMRQTGHPYLLKIADAGLHGMTEDPSKVFVNLQASLFDFNSASGDGRRKAAEKVQKSVQGYLAFLKSNKAIDICDTNKLCGPMTIRKTLQDALAQVEKLVQA